MSRCATCGKAINNMSEKELQICKDVIQRHKLLIENTNIPLKALCMECLLSLNSDIENEQGRRRGFYEGIYAIRQFILYHHMDEVAIESVLVTACTVAGEFSIRSGILNLEFEFHNKLKDILHIKTSTVLEKIVEERKNT